MMSVSFLLIGLVMLIALAFLIGLGVLVAVVTKRPGIVAVVGLVMLLMIGGGLVSLVGIRSVPHSYVHPQAGINTYPGVHHDVTILHSESHASSPMPHIGDGTMPVPQIRDGTGESWSGMPTISTPVAVPPSSVSHFRAKFVMFPVFLVCGAVIAVIVAVITRRKSSASTNGGGSWWPALLLIPVFAVLALSFVGYFGLSVTREFGGVPQLETLHQEFGHEHAASSHAEAMRAGEGLVDTVNAESQQAAMMRSANVKRLEVIARAEALRVESMRRANANRLTTNSQADALRRAEVFSAQLQRQFATMNIHELMDLFDAPKVELPPESPETPAMPAPPEASSPAESVAAATVAESQTTDVVKEATAENKLAEAVAEDVKTTVDEPEQTEKPLPEWVDDQPGMVGDDWREVIATDEYATAEECRRATDIYLMLKTAERLQTLAGHAFVNHDRPSLTFHQSMIMADGNVIFDSRAPSHWHDVRLQNLSRMGIGIDEIRRSVVREQHLASRDSPRALDTMYKQYTHAQFTPWFDGQLRKHWDSYRRSERFTMVGVGAGSVLGLLGFVFGLLKVDTLTKGYYTKRLFIGVPAMIIGGIALIIVFDAMIG